MADHEIKIKAFPPVAVVAPGIRKVQKGDTIEFENLTGGSVKIIAAAANVFEKVGGLDPKPIPKDQKRTFTVAASKGTHELSTYYRYKDKTKNNKIRTGFAVGASSPKIIVVPPSQES